MQFRFNEKSYSCNSITDQQLTTKLKTVVLWVKVWNYHLNYDGKIVIELNPWIGILMSIFGCWPVGAWLSIYGPLEWVIICSDKDLASVYCLLNVVHFVRGSKHWKEILKETMGELFWSSRSTLDQWPPYHVIELSLVHVPVSGACVTHNSVII